MRIIENLLKFSFTNEKSDWYWLLSNRVTSTRSNSLVSDFSLVFKSSSINQVFDLLNTLFTTFTSAFFLNILIYYSLLFFIIPKITLDIFKLDSNLFWFELNWSEAFLRKSTSKSSDTLKFLWWSSLWFLLLRKLFAFSTSMTGSFRLFSLNIFNTQRIIFWKK